MPRCPECDNEIDFTFQVCFYCLDEYDRDYEEDEEVVIDT